jgi:hypothetical protein
LLVYDNYTRGFIVTFPYIHLLYPKLFHPLHYSPSYPIPLLMVISTGFNDSYSYLYWKYTNHIFTVFIYSLLLTSALSFTRPVLLSYHSLFRCVCGSVEILPWYLEIYCSEVNVASLHYSSHPFPPSCVVQQFSVFHCILFLHNVKYFIIIHVLLSFLFSFSLGVL